MDTIVEWTINRTRLRGRGNLAPTGLVVLASALKCLLNSKLDYNQISISYFSNSNSKGKSVKGFATPDEM